VRGVIRLLTFLFRIISTIFWTFSLLIRSFRRSFGVRLHFLTVFHFLSQVILILDTAEWIEGCWIE
jgi:hypothetical protein